MRAKMEQIDFEELIDLGANLSLINTNKQNENMSQKSSQEPLADVLDEMCAAMGENNSVINDSLKDTVANFEGSEEMSEPIIESNLKLHDPVKCDIDEADDDTVVDLDEFEHILAATYLSNNCTELDETNHLADNNNITNTVLEGMIKPVMPYNLPIYFGEIAETCASLAKDNKPTSFLSSAVELGTVAASVNTTDNEIENEYCLETAKLKDIDIFDEDIINLDEFMDDCCCTAEEKDNTSDRKGNKSVNTDNVNDIVATNSDLDDGYNSSDFEFISEDEAKKDGVLFKTKITVNNMNKSVDGNIALGTHTAPNNIIKPTSYKNEASPSEYKKYSKYRYQQCYAELSAEFHVVPEGEQYLDMFRGQFAPVIINNLHVSRNKSVLPNTPMAAKFEDLGFSIPENLEEEHAEYKEEAAECTKKILATYPGENRKRRRRF